MRGCAQIADKVGAVYIFDMAHIAGLVAGGVHPSPVPHAHITTTTTHKTLRGPRAGMILCGQALAAAVDKAVFPGQQGGPLVHIVAAKAVAFGEALRPEFRTYAAQIVANAKALARSLQEAGYRIVSGGTDNHLLLVDVFEKGILGSEAELALGKAGITVNKNAIPYDTNPPLKPSGIRIGTPALTTRGMKEPEMRQIAVWIAKALEQRDDDAALERHSRRSGRDGQPVPALCVAALPGGCRRLTDSSPVSGLLMCARRLCASNAHGAVTLYLPTADSRHAALNAPMLGPRIIQNTTCLHAQG